jgi:autotransporter-associated beta strand protein
MKTHPRLAESSFFSHIHSLIKHSRCLVAVLLLMTAPSGIAQMLYWDQNGATAGTGGAGNWGTASTWRLDSDTGALQNWDNSGAATAVLGGTGGQVLIDSSLASGVIMSALNVDSAGYSIRSTAAARALEVTGTLTLAASAGLTLSMASTGPTWSLGSIAFGLSSTLNVTGNATASNSNRIDLTTTSTISGGSITLSGTAAGPTGFVAYTPTSTPSVQVTLNTNITNNSATSATMLGANFSNTLTYGGVLDGSASLQVSGGQFGGSGIVVLAAENTYTGGTYLNHTSAAVLRLGITDALPTGTTLFFNQSASGGTLSSGGTLDLAGFNQTLAGIVAPSTIRGVANTGSAATLTLDGSGTYLFEAQIGIPSSTTNLTGANNNITVIKNGSGTQTLSGSKAFTGGLYVNSGTLRVTGSVAAFGALPGVASPSVFLRGGTLVVDATAGSMDSASNRGFEIGPTSGTGSMTIQVDGANSFLLNGVLADTPGGSGRLVKTGTGILRMQTTAKTFTGGMEILAGTVSSAIDDRLGAAPASPTPGSITINGGTFLATASYTLNSNRGIALGPDSGAGSGTVEVSDASTLTYSGTVADNAAGSGTLIKTGGGTLRLQNTTNTFTGGVQILAGDVSVGVDDRLGAAPASPTAGHLLLNGGGLTITADMVLNANRGIALGPNTGTGSGTIQVTGANTLTYTGIIADNPGGSGRLVKTGTGTLRLQNAANTFTGGLTVSGGLVSFSLEDRLGAAPVSPTPASLILNGGGLRLTINSIALNANRGIALGPDGGSGTGVLDIDTNRTLTYNGIIADNGAGTGALEKTSEGSVILGGANTYTGGTTLTAGSLIVTNTTGSATGTGSVTTATSTILGGTGIIAPSALSSVIISGSIAPGTPGLNDGIGRLTFTPVGGDASVSGTADLQLLTSGLHGYSVTYNPDGTIASLSGAYTSGGNDQIIFNGGAAANKLDFTSVAAGNVNVTYAGGYSPADKDLFDLLDWSNLTGAGTLNNESSAISGLSTGQLDLPSLSGGLLWDTSFWTSHGVIAIYMPVPEPSRAVLLMLSLGALACRRQRLTLN